jgi:hypothetical protein
MFIGEFYRILFNIYKGLHPGTLRVKIAGMYDLTVK